MNPIPSEGTEYRIVRETTQGVTPLNPVWLPLPSISDSITETANTQVSNTLDPSMQVRESYLMSLDSGGSLEGELARTEGMDLIWESVVSNNWDQTGDPEYLLTVGIAPVFFSLMKRWPNSNDPGNFIYQLYRGCIANQLVIQTSAAAEVSTTIDILGQSVDADRNTAPPAGSTYPELAEYDVITAADVGNIFLDNEAGTLWPEVEGVCVTALTVTVNRNARATNCIGSLTPRSSSIGQFSPTMDMTIFFTGNNFMEELKDQTILNAAVDIGNASTDNHYTVTYPRGKLTANSVVVAAGADVVNQMSFQGQLDVTQDPDTSLIVETLKAGVTRPTFVSGHVENIAPSSVIITFDEDVSVSDSSGVVVMVDDVAATISNEIALNATVDFQLAAPITAGQKVEFRVVDDTNTILSVSNSLNVRRMASLEEVTNNVV